MAYFRWILAGAAISAAGLALAHAGHDQPPPPQVTFASKAHSIPFELWRGSRILVAATLAGHPIEVLLDTGASITTIDAAYARSIGLPAGQKVQARGAGGLVDAEIVPNLTLDVGGMHFDNMTAAVMDLSLVSRGIGRPANAILGREFFNTAVVSIDWSAKRLRLTAHDAFKPDPHSTALGLTKKGPFNTIPIAIAGGPTIQALLDLGNGGALSLPRTYWANRRELAGLKFAETRFGGVGGLLPARTALVPSVNLAGTTLTAVPAILSESGNDQDAEKMANVGIGILQQFKVDLDLGRDRLYLAGRTDRPAFDRDRSGARLDLIGERLKVAFVSPQGPAAKGGLKAGDEIVAVDGRKVSADYYRGGDWTRGAPGTAVALLRADGSKVSVTLRDYY